VREPSTHEKRRTEVEAAEKVTINERGILVVAKVSRLFSFFIKK